MTNENSALKQLLEISMPPSKEDSEKLPSIEQLCISTPLYDELKTQNKMLLSSLKSRVQFDAYCIYCQKDSTFKSIQNSSGRPVDPNWMLKAGNISIEVFCQRNGHHEYRFLFNYDGEKLLKYGQRPSLEDIAGADIRKYEKMLKKGYFGELKRATGLASHGIGIGAFVYLRRIFEMLISDHYEKMVDEGSPVLGFETMRMDEKIGALANVLPAALVQNKATYSILSKGIHELDEIACRKYFPVVRQAIIVILEQDLQRRQREDEAEKLKAEIVAIANEVKKRGDKHSPHSAGR